MKNHYNKMKNGFDFTNKLKTKRTSIQKIFTLFMFLVFFVSNQSYGQSVNNYTFTTGTNASLLLDKNSNALDMLTGSTQIYGGTIDSYTATLQTIGFDFVFMGSMYSQFSCNPDGQIRLGSTPISGHTSSAAAGVPLIIANNVDGKTDATGKVHYKVFGSAPNRVAVIEWKNVWMYWNVTTTNLSTYQVRLYEGTNEIEMVYGRMYQNNTSASTSTIGFSSSNTSGTVGVVTAIATTPAYVGNVTSYTTTSFPASSDMANLNSLADGSRRFFRFSPLTTVAGDVINLSTSAITTNSITVNWDDNATNEIGFILTRATDAGFTQNVVTTTVPSTTSVGTGTAYNSVQSGISAGTNYYFKVVGYLEGGYSTGLTTSVSTLAGATYYWVGTSSSGAPGAFATLTNWNTAADGTGSNPAALATSDTYIVDGDGTTSGGNVYISTAAATSVGQLKVINNTSCYLQSSTTTTRTFTITGGTGDDFVIEAGSSLSLNNATNAAAIAFSGSGNTGSVLGSINLGGSSSNVITTTGGTGTLVTVGSTGIINNAIAGNAGITSSVSTLSFLDGSVINITGQTTGGPNVPLATWATNATLTISGLTTSTTAPTNNNQSFGNIVFNCSALTASYPFFASTTTGVVKGNLIITTGTGQFRTVSSGTVTINGNVNVLAGNYTPFSSTGIVNVLGNTTINTGATINFSVGGGTYVQKGSTFTNNGTITGPNSTTVSTLYFNPTTPIAQTWDGTGTVSAALNTISLNNTSGLTITHSNAIPILRANLFTGNIVGSDKLTIGSGAALNCTIQVGAAGLTSNGGALMAAPTWNLGTGTLTLLYSQCNAYTTSYEIPPTRSATNLTLNNTNGVTLAGGNLELSGALTLTAGNINTSAVNLLTLGTASLAGTLTGGSATSYINGPFRRTIANTNTTFVHYPVGKTTYAPIWLAPQTTSVAQMKAEAFDTNTGTPDGGIMNLAADRRWEALLDNGTFSSINVRLGDANLVTGKIPVQAPTVAGTYTSSFGSTATFVAGTPNTVESSIAVASANYTGYLSYAESNLCSGTPAPGATTATNTTICLGQSTTLGITNIPVGSGVTYQWQSSTNGIDYTDIASATASTLVVTPSVATYYRCNVTCSAGPSTGTSTPIQIIFTNNILTTTPATRCGTGTVELAATANSGATIKWYSAATGGTPLATGGSFTTPSITATTSYYAEAQTSSAGSATIGTNGSTNSSSGITPFSSNFEGSRIQYLITASDLIAKGLTAGDITSLGFKVTTSGSGAFAQSGYTIKIAQVPQTALASAFLTPTFTTVYGPVTEPAPAVGNKMYTFAAPFNWDGSSSLLVEICHDNDPTSTCASCYSSNSTVAATTTSYNSVYGRYADNAALCGSTTAGSAISTFNVRPDFIFNGQVACSSPRTEVIATVTPPPAFSLSDNTATICNGSTTTTPITITTGSSDYTTFVWAPTAGVSGDASAGWVFNPTATTAYVLTASNASGCSTTATVNVTVNPLPSTVVITPSAPSVCVNNIVELNAGLSVVNTKIGSGTSANTTSTPFKGYYGGSKSQALYTASELSALGLTAGFAINNMGYVALSGTPLLLNGFTITAGFVPETTLGSTFISGANTTVYATAAYTPSTGVGNIDFPISTPLVWDGTSSLLVETCFNNNNNGGGTTSNSISVESSTVASGLNLYRSQDSTADVCTNSTTPSSSTTRPNLRISANNTVPLTWAPITNLYTDATATTAYAGENLRKVYVKGSTAGTTTYTTTATSALGCVKTQTVDVTINALPNVVIVNPSAVCSPATVDLTATAVTTGSDAGLTFTYWTDATATTALTTASAVATSGTYYIKGTNANGCFVIQPVTVTVNALPNVVIVNPSAVCSPATVDLTATAVTTGSDAGLTFTYWTDATATTALTTASAVATSGTYYIKGTNANGCSVIQPVNVTVNAQPTVVTVPPTATCAPMIVDLTAASITTGSDAGLTFTYWTDAAATTAVTNPTAVSAGTYYIKGTNANGCFVIQPITITENDCSIGWANLQWPGSGTINTCDSHTVYAQVYKAGVTEPAGQGAGITAWMGISTSNTDPSTWAESAWTLATFNAAASAGNNDEYMHTFTGLAAGNYYIASRFVSTGGTYYYGAYNAGGGGAWNGTTNVNATLTVNEVAAPTGSASQFFCNASTVANLVATGTTIKWYATATGGTALASTDALVSGNHYYASQTVAGCESATRLDVTVTIGTPAPTGDAAQTFVEGSTLADVVVVGTGIVWYASAADASAGANPLPSTTVLVNSTTYYATQTVNSCTSATSLAVTITVTLGNDTFNTISVKYYPNPVTDVLNISALTTLNSVRVINLIGQQVYFKTINATDAQIDLSALPSATYIVEVVAENATKTFKIVKK